MTQIDLVCPERRINGSISILGDLYTVCRGRSDPLVCSCGSTYPIVGGIPIMVPEDKRESLNFPGSVSTEHLEFEPNPTPRVARLIEDYPSEIALDVGCGPGPYIKYFNGHVVFSDINYYYVDKAVRAYEGTHTAIGVVMDARYLAFSENAFDLILCSNIVEHLPPEDIHSTIEFLKTATRGRLQVDVPNETGLVDIVRRLLHAIKVFETTESEDPTYVHLSKFSPNSIRAEGFEVRGCMGWVSRQRIKIKPLWDFYDLLIWRYPILAGTIIGLYDKT